MTEALQGLRPQDDVVAELLRRTASPPIPRPGGVGGLSAQSLSPGWRARVPRNKHHTLLREVFLSDAGRR